MAKKIEKIFKEYPNTLLTVFAFGNFLYFASHNQILMALVSATCVFICGKNARNELK